MATDNLYDLKKDWEQKVAAENGLRAVGYTGKVRYIVTYGDRCATIWAADPWQALVTAARSWGLDARKPDFHQEARAWKC